MEWTHCADGKVTIHPNGARLSLSWRRNGGHGDFWSS